MKPYLSPLFVRVSLTLLCEATANWQPVITAHLACSAPTMQQAFFLKRSRGTFLNWPLGNSIYLRSVAAEFALSSIGFGKIGVKTADKITKVGILLERGYKHRLWGDGVGPTVNSEIGCRLRWGVAASSTSCSACKGNGVTDPGDQ